MKNFIKRLDLLDKILLPVFSSGIVFALFDGQYMHAYLSTLVVVFWLLNAHTKQLNEDLLEINQNLQGLVINLLKINKDMATFYQNEEK